MPEEEEEEESGFNNFVGSCN
jgi:hypothetical protein